MIAYIPATPKVIKMKRLEKNMRSGVFAERIGVSPAYVSKVENGSEKVSQSFALRIAPVLGFSNAIVSTADPGVFFVEVS